MFDPVYKTILNEGANLRVWYQGTGPLFILIPAGGGDGARFNKVIPGLSQRYTVATYDRRGNGASTVAREGLLDPSESARDLAAIIKDLGFSKASLFGPSSGGLIALQLATTSPELVDHIILHEVPTINILTAEPIDRVRATFAVYRTYIEYGPEAALEVFRASVAGKAIETPLLYSSQRRRQPEAETEEEKPHRLDYFFKNEFVVLSIYTPNFAQVQENGVSVVTVEGSDSREMFYAKAARAQARLLDCRHVVWRGGHDVFQTHPEESVDDMIKTLTMLEGD